MVAVKGNQTGHNPVGQDGEKIALQQPSIGDRHSVGTSRPVPCRSLVLQRSPIWSGFSLFVAAVLTVPSARSVVYSTQWTEGAGGNEIGAPAELCEGPQQITVSSHIEPNISSMFACEGGEFNVSWSGVIQVSSTITIGRWTTVRIFGESPKHSSSSVSSTMALASTSARNISEISLSGSSGSYSGSNDYGLNVPQVLTSAVVRANISDSFGPIFSVLDGELHLESVIRGGSATTHSATNAIAMGGGFYANSSTVSISGCVFEENFAELHGGRIHANWSTLIVKDSVFRGNHAGFQSFAGDEDVDGDGGGIGVSALL